MRLSALALLSLLPATILAHDDSRVALRAATIKFLTIQYFDTLPKGAAVCVSIDGATPTDDELFALRRVRAVDAPSECTCELKDADANCLRAPNLGECRVDVSVQAIESATRATLHVSYACGPLNGAGQMAQFVRIDGEWFYESSPHTYVN